MECHVIKSLMSFMLTASLVERGGLQFFTSILTWFGGGVLVVSAAVGGLQIGSAGLAVLDSSISVHVDFGL